MKFIDLQQQYQLLKAPIDEAIANVLAHGQFLMGPEITELEQQLAAYVGVNHALLCSSGTTALQIALMALHIGPGDEVITSPFSFFATAEVILLLGAKAVYVDIDPKTYNLDPALLEQAISPRTKAIVPVSMFGQCADMDKINEIAAKFDIPVIEDAAQSFGALYKGRRSGGLSTMACTSFFPSKPLGAYGDAGACFTNDDELAHKMRLILNHGQRERYHHIAVGINGRCDSIQAGILLAKMRVFDEEIAKRQVVAEWYNQVFSGRVSTPYVELHNQSAYAQYTIYVENREDLQRALSERGIPTAVHYPRGLHEQPIALQLNPEPVHCPMAENASKHVLSLPFHPYMKPADVATVAETVIDALHTLISEYA
jgi:UDP-2-acetamido-2-deoxy-ribo-hexuluronate aminotransferase